MAGGGLVGTLAAWLLVDRFGAPGFALFSLLSTILIMLPFADLGLGASAVNIASDYSAGRLTFEQLAVRYKKIRAILSLVGLVIIGSALAIGLMRGWTILLGNALDSTQAQLTVTIMFSILGASVPLGIGSRMMQGRGSMDRVTKIASLNPLIQIIFIAPFVWLLPSAAFVAFLPALAYLAVAVVTDHRSRRIDGRVLPFFPRYDAMRYPISNLWKSSLSFMVMSLGMLFVFQSQRIILAHRSSVDQLAEFSLVAQYLIPVLALIVALSQALWPKYRNAGAKLTFPIFRRHVGVFSFGGIVGSFVLCCVVVAVSRGLFGSTITVEWQTLLAASIYLTAMAAYQPCSMLLTHPDGLRVQSIITVVSSAASVATGVSLAPSLGSRGAFLAAGLCVVVFQLIPTYLVARRHIKLSSLVHGVFRQLV
ncbi:hypothetical protein CH254_22190 [Rhodococcus sp. 06-412-2C]|uniref:lipopolysaccharide biosynthesis protein n=1 Tax=unclassified Rhodococcus (in: high G+C Gram-positive bacteria) TaxID=192944 RepID=UPI000B9A5570|nr:MULTISPECIES: hypothetical protein [unclassified Rhodococcus (in: high G+C Gram-positive bacteria)]OZC83646.1 hypothetical protein CH254_22190 [Rhodococcus sp. 06-412-2C]OZC93833.1 hypothetical protein CH279_20270 [Rhodococcus sp. 06-412-2B]